MRLCLKNKYEKFKRTEYLTYYSNFKDIKKCSSYALSREVYKFYNFVIGILILID